MADWAPEGFGNKHRAGSLEESVTRLSPKAKQAFYAAAKHGAIARGTWNGCAFNAGGKEIGKDISNYDTAAAAFEMEVADVRNFIRYWDASTRHIKTDEEATETLTSILLEVGLFTDPPGTVGAGSFVKVIHKQQLSEQEEFDRIVAELDDPDNVSEFKCATIEAQELLFA